ncbi:Bacterial regulatory protein, ArsR domain protein [mine drainage metagenome]|uniref:Bacterial regulatory protein, ArsR domain protein n=1 Tax=mine drainage metagenome TaxID=410659 RepID=T0ZHQ1_9ZZZZ
MSASRIEIGLEERLLRLRREAPSCSCVPAYVDDARKIRLSPKFPVALARLRALADESRLLAVALLKRREELCACEIQAAMGLTHATVSHHMRALIDAGIVRARRDGKWMYYRLAWAPEELLP